jgi:hypothetical protein
MEGYRLLMPPGCSTNSPPAIVNVTEVVFGDGAVAGDGIALGVVAVIDNVSDAVYVYVDVDVTAGG